MRGDITPTLVTLFLLVAGIGAVVPPAAGAHAALVGAPELRGASPEFGLAQWGWAYQWVELHYRQDVICAGHCYTDFEWVVMANEHRVEAPDDRNWFPGVESYGSAWSYDEDDGIHYGVASFSAEWIGTRYVQVATRASPDDPWRVGEPAPYDVLSGDSADGDGIPDALEARLCANGEHASLLADLADASCAGGDLTLPMPALLRLPLAPAQGGDADEDGFPETVRLTGTRIELGPSSGSVAGVPWRDVPFDVRIGGDRPDAFLRLPHEPDGVHLCMPVPMATVVAIRGDADHDGVPTFASASSATACYDTTFPHFVDALASAPITLLVDPEPDQPDPQLSYPLALGAFALHIAYTQDADADGIPAGAEALWARPALEEDGRILEALAWTKQAWDANDSVADAPVPLVKVDVDQDDVPDAAEPLVCAMIEDGNLHHDGTCDGTGDYAPPETYRSAFRAPFFLADDDHDLVLDAAEAPACDAYDRRAPALPILGKPACAL